MIYPKFLNKNDKIGITAISDGVADKVKQQRLDNAIKNISNMGYNIIETNNVRTSFMGRSSNASKRAEEFMKLWEDNDINAIMVVSGGDFALEILDFIDFSKIKKFTPKWLTGFSDVTSLSFVLTTKLDISTVYCDNFTSFGMKPLDISLQNIFKILEGNKNIQESFNKFQNEHLDYTENPYISYNLNEDVKWEGVNNNKIHFNGRIIGGCFDIITSIIGTKYDNIKKYIETYKQDGIIWFFDVFSMTSSSLTINLWKMKNAGLFDNCNGIIFGRNLFFKEEYDITFKSILESIYNELKIPIIFNADIGHKPPQMTIINGSIVDVELNNNKGKITTKFI